MTVTPNAICPKCSGPATRAFVETYCLNCDPKTVSTKSLPYKVVTLADGATAHFYSTGKDVPKDGKYIKGYYWVEELSGSTVSIKERDMWSIVQCYGSYEELLRCSVDMPWIILK